MRKLKIAVLFGGCSEEHDVSIKSAQEIARHINLEKFDPVYIGITCAGAWRLCEAPGAGWEEGECRPAILSPDRGTHGLLLQEGGTWRAMHIDLVFPVLHGKTGEDGAIQGLMELSGIPYIGCGIESSAACMDKALAHLVVRDAGVAVPAFRVLEEGEEAETGGLEYPVFVKPARSGSSFGVSKVENAGELRDAIALARAYDSKVLIEQAVIGTEVGCAILGNGGELAVGEVDQITLSHGFFRIHQEEEPEQGSENAVVTVPAEVPPEKREEIRETARRIYRALGCKGLARVDLFLRQDGGIVFNEVNTLPGFTPYSRYPRMMQAAGVTVSETIDRLADLALGR